MKTRIGVIFVALYTSLIGIRAADEVFFGNLHSHTSYSDGVSIPDIAYAHARDTAKVDFLAITEHNHLPGATRIGGNPELYSGAIPTSLISTARRLNNDGHFVAIYGQEFSSIDSGNHANVFEVGEVIRTNDVPLGQWDALFNTWLPAHLDSSGQPAIMLLNHPATSASPNSKEYGIDDLPFALWLAAMDKHVSLINIINGPSHAGEDHPGHPSESEFLRYLAMGIHVAPTADQDNHLPNWGDAAKPRTAIIAPSLTKANILAAMRSRHVYATEDPNLKIIGTVNGKLMGTRFQGTDVPAPNSTLNISVKISDADEPTALYRIDVYQDTLGDNVVADVVTPPTNVQGDGTFAVTGVKYAGGKQYFFLKITQTDDDHVLKDQAWLAPVWFEPGTPGTPAPPTAITALALDVDVIAEKAVIANVGTTTVNLKDWTLVSVAGDQRFKFSSDLMLMPTKSVTVTSGPMAVDAPPEFVRWSTSAKWSNSGDPGRLLNPDGTVMAKTD